MIIVRNITGGAYAGPDQRVESDGTCDAEDRIVLNPQRVQEVFDIGVEHARAHPGRRVISVDKASVYATSRLWRRISHGHRRRDRRRDRQRQRRPCRLRARQVRPSCPR